MTPFSSLSAEVRGGYASDVARLRIAGMALVACGTRTGLGGDGVATTPPDGPVFCDPSIRGAVTLAGGPPAGLLIWDLAADATHLYWSGSSVQRVSKAGGAPEWVAGGSPENVVLDDAYVYWNVTRARGASV